MNFTVDFNQIKVSVVLFHTLIGNDIGNNNAVAIGNGLMSLQELQMDMLLQLCVF